MSSASLVAQFRHARLSLKVAPAPLVSVGNTAIVQLDIARKPQQFLLWPGAQNNRVAVQGIDRDLRQLVLFVDEPTRAFELRVRRSSASRELVVRRDAHPAFVWVQRTTPGGHRHLLCGMDEQHYFIAQLPERVTTVRDAHEALANPEASRQAQRALGKAIRQGEWFFLPLTTAEAQAVEALARGGALVSRHVAVTDGAEKFRRGRPHLVDELLRVREAAKGSVLVNGSVFVRGRVRHPDHRVAELLQWHRVFGNREASAPPTMTWVD